MFSIPRTPKGHKRSADLISNAVQAIKLATSEDEEELTEDGKNKTAVPTNAGSHATAGGRAEPARWPPAVPR